MHPKEIVVGLAFNGTHKAYKQSDIESKVIINDSGRFTGYTATFHV